MRTRVWGPSTSWLLRIREAATALRMTEWWEYQRRNSLSHVSQKRRDMGTGTRLQIRLFFLTFSFEPFRLDEVDSRTVAVLLEQV